MWIAGKRMKIKKSDGSYAMVDPGDPVPEADDWPNKSPWIRGGFIKKSGSGESAETDEALTSKKAPALSRRPADQPPSEVKADTDADTDTDPETDTDEVVKLTGPGECPDCKKDFLMLERHKCKKVPQ